MTMGQSIHEECGVVGVYDRSGADVTAMTYTALYALQHRGQESCGIAVNDDGVITGYKQVGLVGDVFTEQALKSLGSGQIAVGHVRYSTTGDDLRLNCQPLVVNHCKGSMALAHNGNLTNADALRRELELSGSIFQTTSDTEVISYIITRERLSAPSIETAVERAVSRLQGAFSLVIMSPTKLIAVRDPLGFRPLCLGRTETGVVVASESCALDAVGAVMERDLRPGEIVVADESGTRSIETHCGGKSALCVFEFVYFARPDSVIDGSSVHLARQRAGRLLAEEHPVDADVVVGVPDSGLDAALGFSRASGIPYGIGFIKNRYIARTFIQPTQRQRENDVRIKLNPLSQTVRGKRVVLIDDSIVRGTTSARIVKLLRDAGAKEVHVRISAPPFRHPCYFGTDIDSEDHLIACRYTVPEITRVIGADSLGYLSVEGVKSLARETDLGFCCACFDGKYPVAVNPESATKNRFERKLSERRQLTMENI